MPQSVQPLWSARVLVLVQALVLARELASAEQRSVVVRVSVPVVRSLPKQVQ